MAGYEQLLEDPIAALGYGLLTGGDQPLQAAMGVLAQGQQIKRQRRQDEMQEKLFEMKTKQAGQPDIDYKFNPVTGELIGINNSTGSASPIDYYGGSGGGSVRSDAEALEPLEFGGESGGADIPDAPAGLNPKERQTWRENYIKQSIEDQFPSPQEKLKMEEAEVRKEKAMRLKDDIQRLTGDLLAPENRGALESSVGPISSRLPTFSGETADFEAKADQLRSILTAENLDLMSGVLSETDVKILADIAGGGLNPRRSEEGFIAELERMQGSEAFGGRPKPEGLPSGQSVKFLGWE